MSLPEVFYAEPRFRKASPDFGKLKGASNLTLNTPGVGLALAMGYYKVEAFVHRDDRDKACGPTAHPDVRYFPVERKELLDRRQSPYEIACGHAVDHPDFATILDPLFWQAMSRLLRAVGRKRRKADASEILTIARARYSISATWNGNWLNFSVDACSAFEEISADVMDRTMRQLNDRFALHIAPTPPERTN